MAYKVELPPFSKAIENKGDSFRANFKEPESDPGLRQFVTAKSPLPPVTPVASGGRISDDDGASLIPEEPVRLPEARFSLVINRASPMPSAPITHNGWTKITNPERFIEATLADLAACVAGRNAGKSHWVEDLLNEKIAALKLCGVEAEIINIQ